MNSNSHERIQSGSPLDAFLHRLDGVERTSSGYKALCPAHDDNNPSLSLREEQNRVLLHCHAGCETDEIVQALGLEMSDLFVEKVDASWKPWDGTEVETYTYKDADGSPLFQVVRFEMQDESHPACGEKKFLQRAYTPSHEDAGRKGCPEGYVWGRQDTEAVLYNLPGVLSAVEEGDLVYFVEGEEDVHTLLSEGLTATCNPGGAAKGGDPGEKLTPSMIEPLRGADVVVIPDADEPGRQFAKAVAKRLYSVASQVRLVELPGVEEGGDVTDFLQDGHTVEDLVEIVEETEPFEPPPETVEELVERAKENGDPAFVYDHVRVLAEATEAEYRKARQGLKEATGINLNGLESTRQDEIERIEEEEKKQQWERLDADELPTIRLGDDRPSREVVQEAVEAYEAFNDPPSQFSRGQEPVRVTENEEGRPVFESVDEALFDALLNRAANFVRGTKDGIIYADPPLRLVRQVRQLVDLPHVKEIRELPFLRPDGTVVRDPGYDEETCVLYRPNPDVEVPDVPEVPSEEDVKRAVSLLTEPFQDFPFVDRASRANLLATVFTPVVRPLLDGANLPLIIFDATKQGTGKTLLADVVALMGTGRVPATMNAPASNEEWRKQITSQLRKGEPIVVVDNVKGYLSSSALERVLTAQTWGDRLLGHSKQLKLPADVLWIATGNNLRPRGEMTRRCVLVRMDAQMVHPWKRRGFEHPNLREWVRSNRGRLVAALLTAVRSWIEDGQPRPDVETLGSFERWAEVVGGVLQHIGVDGFLENLDELYETATGQEHQWSRLLEALCAWSTEDGEPTPFTTRELSDDLKDHAEGRIGAETDELEAIRDNLPEKLRKQLRYGEPIARSLGKAFEYREGRRFPGGWHLERAKRDREGVHWIVHKDDAEDELPGDGPRDSVTLDPPNSGSEHPPSPEDEEGGGGPSHKAAHLKSQTNGLPDEAPF